MAQTITGKERQRNVEWMPILASGFLAGLIFLLLEMVLVSTVGGGSAWGPPRMMAAIILGPDVLPPPATYDGGIFFAALVVHFGLSFVLAAILAVGIEKMSSGMAMLTGAIFGLAVYYINFHLIAPAAFPWFIMAQNWITIFSHIVFGLVAAWAYKAFAWRPRRRISA